MSRQLSIIKEQLGCPKVFIPTATSHLYSYFASNADLFKGLAGNVQLKMGGTFLSTDSVPVPSGHGGKAVRA
jgi:hypothetical protein